MKKFLLYGALFSALTFGFSACSDDDNDPSTDPDIENETDDADVTTTGVYILNSGSSGNNNSNLGYYDPSSQIYTQKVFETQNGIKIGDTGNDMVIYGSKMYIIVTSSNKIYITDLKGKLLTYSDGTNAIIEPQIENSEPSSPRYGTAYDGKVYVSTKAGYVTRIDTTSMLIDATVKVGSYPEQMTAVNNKLYVPNSGYGSGNTMSIVDLSTFTETKTVTVIQNPNYTISDNNGNIYIISWGDFQETQAVLQRYSLSDDELTVLGTGIVSKAALNKDQDKLLLMCQVYDANWSSTLNLQSFDLKTNTLNEDSFIDAPSGMDVSQIYSLTVDPISGDIYISTSSYSTNGDMYVFSADGTYKDKFDTQGRYPIGAYFVTGVN